MNMNKFSTENIYKHLDSIASGQKNAKIALSYIGFMYQARRQIKARVDKTVNLKKSNALLMGPTGCGKTHLTRALGRYLDLPFIEIDAPTTTPTGYNGNSMADIIVEELNNYARTNYVNGPLEHAIIFIDEVDKLCFRSETTRSDDFNMEKQNDILKLVEGKVIDTKHGKYDTTNFLFILAGSFMHMDRNKTRKSMGFSNKLEVPLEDNQESLHKDVIKAGLKPELAGRVSLVVELGELSKQDLREAFMDVENNLYSQYKTLFNYTNNKTFELTEDEIEEILTQCQKNGTGARGLQTELDNVLFKKNIKLEIEIPQAKVFSFPKDKSEILTIRFRGQHVDLSSTKKDT